MSEASTSDRSSAWGWGVLSALAAFAFGLVMGAADKAPTLDGQGQLVMAYNWAAFVPFAAVGILLLGVAGIVSTLLPPAAPGKYRQAMTDQNASELGY